MGTRQKNWLRVATDSPGGAASANVLWTKQERTNPVSEHGHTRSTTMQLSRSDLTASFSSKLAFKEQKAPSSVTHPNHDKAQQFLHRGCLVG